MIITIIIFVLILFFLIIKTNNKKKETKENNINKNNIQSRNIKEEQKNNKDGLYTKYSDDKKIQKVYKNSDKVFKTPQLTEEKDQTIDINKINTDTSSWEKFNTIDKIKKIVESNPKNINYVDKFGKTPLMLSIQFNNYEVFKWLLENGADVNYVEPESRMFIINKTTNEIQFAENTAKFDNPEKIFFTNEYSALMFAVQWKLDIDFCVKQRQPLKNIYVKELIEKGADINKIVDTDDGEETPLILAIKRNNVVVVKQLLDAGADIKLMGTYEEIDALACANNMHTLIEAKLKSEYNKISGDILNNKKQMIPFYNELTSSNIIQEMIIRQIQINDKSYKYSNLRAVEELLDNFGLIPFILLMGSDKMELNQKEELYRELYIYIQKNITNPKVKRVADVILSSDLQIIFTMFGYILTKEDNT